MSVRLLLMALVLAAPSLARAQADLALDADQPEHLIASSPETKSEKTAYRLSFGLTLGLSDLGAAMMFTGVMGAMGWWSGSEAVFLTGLGILSVGLSIAPSIGHLYAGEYGRALGFMALRLLGEGLAVGLCGAAFTDYSSARGYACLAGAGLSLLGILVFDGYDIWDTKHAVARANAKHEVSLLPVIARVGNSMAYGLGVGAAF